MNKLEKIVTDNVLRTIPSNREFGYLSSMQAVYYNGEKTVIADTMVWVSKDDHLMTEIRNMYTLKELGGGSYLTKLWNQL